MSDVELAEIYRKRAEYRSEMCRQMVAAWNADDAAKRAAGDLRILARDARWERAWREMELKDPYAMPTVEELLGR